MQHSDDMHFVLCTRDRIDLALDLLEETSRCLREAFPNKRGRFIIFDDSTTTDKSIQLRKSINDRSYQNLRISVIGRREQSNLMQQLQDDSCELKRNTCFREMGRGPWDLAGVRNFAFLYAFLMLPGDDVVVFLDDDMRFESLEYHGHSFNIDGAGVLLELYDLIRNQHAVAAGTGYWGRADMSILEHLCLTAEELLGNPVKQETPSSSFRILVDFPSTLPISIHDQVAFNDPRHGDGPAGISGAVLALHPRALKSHCLPRLYNEDWIWLLLLGDPSREIMRITNGVIHAAPPQSPVDMSFFLYQERGQIVYNALEGFLRDYSGSTDRITWTQRHLNQGIFSHSKQEETIIVRDCLDRYRRLQQLVGVRSENRRIRTAIDSICDFLEDAISGINAISAQECYLNVMTYLSEVEQWRSLFRRVRPGQYQM